MTDEQYGADSNRMVIQLKLFEALIDSFNQKIPFDKEKWLEGLDSFNLGREILDRGCLRMFFGGGPKGINKRIRESLIKKMLEVDKQYPSLKGKNFDEELKAEMSKLV